jgi:hypothetical protein
MTSPLRKSKKVWIVTLREVDREVPTGVVTTFRSAYQIALLDGRISKPCLSERLARILYRKTNLCLLWNVDEFETVEEAMYSPVGRLVKIQEVPVRRT